MKDIKDMAGDVNVVASKRDEEQWVAWLHVAVPESSVPEPLRRGLALFAAAAAGEMGIPVPTIGYFQSLQLRDEGDHYRALTILEKPQRVTDADGMRRAWVGCYRPGTWLCGLACATDLHTIWVNTQRYAGCMAGTVQHETRHLYQFWLEAALTGVHPTELPFNPEITARREADAEWYVGETQWDMAESVAMRAAWDAWDELVGPLFEDNTQMIFPTSYSAFTLWGITWVGADWALDEEAA